MTGIPNKIELSASSALPGVSKAPHLAPARLKLLRGTNPARLTKIDDDEGGEVGDFRLYSIYKGSRVELDVRNKKKGKEKEIKKLTKEIWSRAKAELPEGAKDLRVNFSHRFIAYTDKDGVVHYMNKEKTDPEFSDVMKKVRSLSKDLWRNVYFPESDTNRASMGDQHLEISSQKWANKQPDSLKAYLDSKSHFGFQHLHDAIVVSNGGADPRNAALDKIVGAEAFLHNIHDEVRNLALAKEQIILDQTTPKLDRKNAEKALRDLREFLNRLATQKIDRNALFCALGVWGDTDPSIAGIHTRKAEEISDTMQRILNNGLNPGIDDRGSFKRIGHWISKNPEGQLREGLRPYVREYAQETGDLVIHNRFEHRKRVERDERTAKSVSMEEFIAHQMIHLDQADLNIEESLDALGIKFDRATHADLTAALKKVHADAKTMRQAAASITAPTWQERVQAMKANPQLTGLFK